MGTEIFKSLELSKKYKIFGADVSRYAYGLYQQGFQKTYLVKKESYISDILAVCKKEKVGAIIPGGEEPLLLLSENRKLFEKNGILLAVNSDKVVNLCTDKIKTFNYLRKKGIPVPETLVIESESLVDGLHYPCIVKPARRSGGSVFTYLARDRNEATLHLDYLKKRNIEAVVQEYIPETEGEYTVGVLSLSTGEVFGSIALKRFFNAKLSVLMKSDDAIISSGYSQGLIDDFKEIRNQSERIAKTLDSRGPINIQGRLRGGTFYPFEINPRFSATTYLRAMAGFNEIDIYLQILLGRKKPAAKKIKYGYYFRTLSEEFVGFKELKKYD